MIGFAALFGGSKWIKWLAIAAVLLAVGGTIFAGYTYVNNLQDENKRLTTENATLVANNAQLEQAITDQRETIASLEEDFRLQGEILVSTNEGFQAARDQVNDLRDRLGRHELGFLAANRPGLVEGVVNNASDNIARCFEIASGAPLTAAEENATRPSEINRECPELANPNYRGE